MGWSSIIKAYTTQLPKKAEKKEPLSPTTDEDSEKTSWTAEDDELLDEVLGEDETPVDLSSD